MDEKRPYIVIDAQDNVATVVRELTKGVVVSTDGPPVNIRQTIPYGHKFALRDIAAGDYIVKYGAQIGRATTPIACGDHVHVHNVEDIVDEVRKR